MILLKENEGMCLLNILLYNHINMYNRLLKVTELERGKKKKTTTKNAFEKEY